MKILFFILYPLIIFAADGQVAKLKVDHLVCEVCAAKLRKELEPICKNLSIDVPKRTVTCAYESPVTPKEILTHANKTGLDAKLIP